MAKFALLINNMIDNIIVADSLEEATILGNVVESTEENTAYIGWIYNPETGTFYDPNPVVDDIIVEETNA